MRDAPRVSGPRLVSVGGKMVADPPTEGDGPILPPPGLYGETIVLLADWSSHAAFAEPKRLSEAEAFLFLASWLATEPAPEIAEVGFRLVMRQSS